MLTQIIFEEENKGQNLLPIRFLRQLIRMYGDSLQAFVPGYLDLSMESFAKNQEQMRNRLAEAFGGGSSALEAMTRQNLAIFDRAMKMFSPFGHGRRGGARARDASERHGGSPRPNRPKRSPSSRARSRRCASNSPNSRSSASSHPSTEACAGMYDVTLTRSHFPAQADDSVRETTIASVLCEAAAAAPDAMALVETDMDGARRRRWRYADLFADAEKLALALSTHFAAGERVAVWAPNIPEWVVLEFAASLAGLVLVTVNPAYQAKELDYVLRQSRASGLFLVQGFRGNPMAEIAAKVCAELPAIRRIADMEDADAFYTRGTRPAGLADVKSGDAAQIQYTSGTTGFPKGAVLSHCGLTNNSRFGCARLGMREGDSYLNVMPMFHTAGCSMGVLGSVQHRAQMFLPRQFDAIAANRIIAREGVTLSMGVPTMLIGMLEAYGREPCDMSSLRALVSGGAMVPPELIRKLRKTFGCAFEIVYGQTETSPILTQTRTDDPEDDVLNSVGQALPQTEISIRDIGMNTVMPLDTVGEICSRGYCNMIGYNDDMDATMDAIDANGWLHTGDLGTMDARGFVRVTGRVKEMIIRGGENLFPAEIENVLLEHSGIAEVAVVGVPDETWGEVAVCFFRAAGAVPPREALVAHLRSQLAAPKTPAHFIAVEDFPLTGSGKVQKFVLRERFVAGDYPQRL